MRLDPRLEALHAERERLIAERNRLNAEKSCGPRTEEGKRIASLNAVKTGLTGRTVLLPTDDAEAYQQHLAAYQNEYRPVGLRETELVQSLADTQWRLQRIPGLEMALYARGRREFAESYPEQKDLALRTALIDLDIHLKYEKQLKNLQLQESRLHRRYEKEMTELHQLQKERKATEKKPKVASAGFVFSTEPTTSATPTVIGVDPRSSAAHKPAAPAEVTSVPQAA
jgi:hypothetical protein